MAVDLGRKAVLEATIRLVAPINGVDFVDSTLDPPTVNVLFKPTATLQQQALALTIVAAFDWRPRVLLSRDEVVNNVNALTANQREDYIKHWVVRLTLQDPINAEAILSIAGIPLPINAVVP